MFELSVRGRFSAAHRVKGHKGKCAGLHGHNWEVEVGLRGEELDATGFLVDFGDVKAACADVLEQFDHQDLNAVPPFLEESPTSERLARYIFRQLAAVLNCPGYRVCRVTVWEGPMTSVTYTEPAAGA